MYICIYICIYLHVQLTPAKMNDADNEHSLYRTRSSVPRVSLLKSYMYIHMYIFCIWSFRNIVYSLTLVYRYFPIIR